MKARINKTFALICTLLMLWCGLPLKGDTAGGIEPPPAQKTITVEKIKTDCAFSVGGSCVCAYYLQKYNMRFQAAPLDWMFDYSLDTAAYFFETKFSDFFKNTKIIPNKLSGNNLFVEDTQHHIISIHHFNKNKNFRKEKKRLRKIFLQRAQKIDQIFNDSESIALINCRELTNAQNYTHQNYKPSNRDELINFAQRFSKIYPNKNIYLININNTDSEKITSEVLFHENKVKVIQFNFKNQDKKKYPGFKGNPSGWKVVMESLELTDKFKHLRNKKLKAFD